jgi:hypothetical protein
MSIIARHRIAARLRFCLKPKLTAGRRAVSVGVEAVGKPVLPLPGRNVVGMFASALGDRAGTTRGLATSRVI